jgi:hypothetical protein
MQYLFHNDLLIHLIENPGTLQVLDFFDTRVLLVSGEKSTVTIFTPHSAQAKLHPTFGFRDVGTTGKASENFGCNARSNVLKALAGSSCG